MLRLVITCDGTRVDEVTVTRGALTVGRKTDNDIHIPEPTVSSHHARVVANGNGAYVEDLESTNGTYVNGQAVTRQTLSEGDTIMIGRYKLLYTAQASSARDIPEPTRRFTRSELARLLANAAGSGAEASEGAHAKAINWVAQDPDGTWWGFENKPFPTLHGWSESGRGRQVKLKQAEPNTEWRATRQRV